MIEQKLGIDSKDKAIIGIIGNDPTVSQAEIGKGVNLSQPSVGARIQKLRRKGIVSIVSGVDFRVVELFLAKVEVQATDTKTVLESFDHCPFFLNGLVLSGTDNLCLFLTAPSIGELEEVVNYHLRAHENVKNVRMDIVIKPSRQFVLPVSFETNGCEDKKGYRERCSVCPVRGKVFGN
jgi:Lrp/AsnC family transcriptional regulator, leucine-responsive regulatory protein